MKLLRKLALFCLKINTRVFAKWVMGTANQRADFLSHQEISHFKKLTRNDRIDEYPEKLPEELWPATKLFEKGSKI